MSLLCRLEALHVEECHGKRAEEEDSLMTHRWTSKMEDQGPERTLCTFSCGLRSSACTSLRAKPDRSGRFTSGGSAAVAAPAVMDSISASLEEIVVLASSRNSSKAWAAVERWAREGVPWAKLTSSRTTPYLTFVSS
eukprot:s1200_g20.t2